MPKCGHIICSLHFAGATFALLPSVAHNVSDSAVAYGILLGCFGAGAVGGALLLQPARARWSTEAIASTAVAVLGVTLLATGMVRALGGLIVVMLVGGAAWLIFIALVNALAQTLSPDWVRARVLAIFLLVTQGGLAAGSALWGSVAGRASVKTALLWAGVGTIATTVLGLVARLPDVGGDVSPWNHWRMPAIVKDAAPALEQGPVLVTLEYVVDQEHAKQFLEAMRRFGRVRRRDGATRWGIFRDLEHPDLYLEVFLVSSWAEHLRQHERLTRGDRELEDRLHGYVRGDPKVRHLVSPAEED